MYDSLGPEFDVSRAILQDAIHVQEHRLLFETRSSEARHPSTVPYDDRMYDRTKRCANLSCARPHCQQMSRRDDSEAHIGLCFQGSRPGSLISSVK